MPPPTCCGASSTAPGRLDRYKAAEGKRLHKLEPDPVTEPVVRRIFEEYVAGRGMTTIARGLTQDGIPWPSAYDRQRNPHRHNEVWVRRDNGM